MTDSQHSADHGDDFDDIIPYRILLLRQVFELSAADLDRAAGFAAGTTGRLERHDQRVYASHLIKICQVTDIDLNYFYNQHDPQLVPTTHVKQEQIRLLNAYHQIEDIATKRNVFELIEALAVEHPSSDAK